MKSILVLGEKPYSNKSIAPHVVEAYPGRNISFINILPYTNPQQVYPRDLHWSDYPVLAAPKYKELNSTFTGFEIKNGGSFSHASISIEEFMQADEILVACDFDHTGAISTLTILDAVQRQFGALPKVMGIKLTEYSDEGIIAAINNKQEFNKLFDKHIKFGQVKRYFDWNWNVNSQAILGKTLRAAGANEKAYLSKFSLQLLFYLRKQGAMTDNQIMQSMSRWRGNGGYPVSDNFGTVASRQAILESLNDAELMVQEGRNIQITPIGYELLNLLHKDCSDQDLPTRLQQWCDEGMGVAKPKIDQYINRFFGKQKQFIDLQLNKKPSLKPN